MRAVFDRDFGAPNADANGAAAGAMLLSTQTDQSTAQRLLNGADVADANGQNGIPGLLLNPSAPTFRPGIGDQQGDTVKSGRFWVST